MSSQGADATPASEDVNVEAVAVEKEVTKSEESVKINDKEPETPVTEPLTNGSSAPETPKDESKPNGDAASIDQPSPVESAAEIPKETEAPQTEVIESQEDKEKVDTPKVEEKVEESIVDALPVNGLKIDDTLSEEIKPSVAEVLSAEIPKVEDAPSSEIKVEPTQDISAVVADTEVCVEKEKSEVVGNTEVTPPPLPTSPPPSSLTMFAESTMAPLVDTHVDNVPVVDVDASITSLPLLTPVTDLKDNDQQKDSQAPNVCENSAPENIAPIPENISIEPSETSLSEKNESSNALIDQTLEKDNDNEKSEVTPIVENIAVVSNECVDPIIPETINAPLLIKPSNESPPTPIENISDTQNVETDITPNEPKVPETNENSLEQINTEIVSNEGITNSPVEEIVPISDNATDSPVLQRAPSDVDVSDTALVEPQSDSFPPPPPPESCPESMTELSVSESLPPPMSDFSLPDAILNSPTSETAELPSKDEILLKDDKAPDQQELESSLKTEVEAVEVNGLPAAADVTEVKESPIGEPAEQIDQLPSDTVQVKSVSQVAADVAEVTSEVTESANSGDSVVVAE